MKNRQKVTLKEKGEHFVAKFLLLKEYLEAKLDFPMCSCDIYGYYLPIMKSSA
jgi:hypothetical protein